MPIENSTDSAPSLKKDKYSQSKSGKGIAASGINFVDGVSDAPSDKTGVKTLASKFYSVEDQVCENPNKFKSKQDKIFESQTPKIEISEEKDL